MLSKHVSSIGKMLPLILTLASVSAAQDIQRLLIPETTLHLAPNGAAEITTLCTDYGIVGPKAGQNYSHLLSGSESIRLTIGGKVMSLEQAISQGKLRLETPVPTVAEYLRTEQMLGRLNPGTYDPEWAQAEKKLLESLPVSVRNEILAKKQNPGRLKITNLSGEPVEFWSGGALVGTEEQAPSRIPANLLKTAGSKTNPQAPAQDKLWIAQLQDELSDVGYALSPDGTVGTHTAAALRDFQRQHGLEVTGTPTFETAKKLHEAGAQARLTERTKSFENSGFLVLRVENRTTDADRFRVISPAGTEVYTGSRKDEMIAAIAAFPAPQGKDKYLSLENFSQKQQENLAAGFRMNADIVAVPHDLNDLSVKGNLDEFVLQRGIKLVETGPIEELPVEDTRGRFRMVLDFVVRARNTTKDLMKHIYLHAYARVREHLETFFKGAIGAQQSDLSEEDTVAAFVARGRKNLIDTFKDAHTVDLLITDTQSRKIADNWIRRASPAIAGL
jgi:peptidoglycan hydrolase-like protein with peptidoglycan-binding domain